MKIEIADRLKPFSHTPGHEVLIPSTHWKAKVCPAAFFLTDTICNKSIEFFLSLTGPVFPFTIENDLENKILRVYGEAVQGYFRFILQRQGRKLVLCFEKTPLKGIELFSSLEERAKMVFSGDTFVVSEDLEEAPYFPKERLFLGSSKKKDWDAIRVRKDLREILPLWFLSGLITPPVLAEETGQQFEWIEKRPEKIYDALMQMYLSHFSKGLVPRSQDEEFQGFYSSKETFKGVLNVLREGAFFIRSLFFQEKEGKICILPMIPPQFVSGKMIRVKSENGDLFDFEWTKHKLRRMYIEVQQDCCFELQFPSEVQTFRLRKSLKEKGCIISKNDPFLAKAGDLLWLDLFQK